MNEYQPDEQAQAKQEERRIALLDSLGQTLAACRQEAIDGRATSGIEDDWEQDEEFYQGIDDANRHEFPNQQQNKPTQGGSTAPRKRRKGSTVFPNLTQPYVDAAAARIGDMLLPTDDRNFSIEPTPIPDMPQPSQPMQVDAMGQPVAPVDPQALTAQTKEDATARAKKAQDQVDDWLVECQYHSELRKAIDDCAKSGSGVIKGPFPVVRKNKAWRDIGQGVTELYIKKEIKPTSKRIDYWNFFPDPACGDSIHDGSYTWERDFLTEQKLRDLKGVPDYITSQIDLCIAEGPIKYINGGRFDGTDKSSKRKQYEIWYYHGIIKKDDLLAAGYEPMEGERLADTVNGLITMVNDRVIRAKLNPLDSGDFPYDVIPWKRRPNMPWGTGIARQARTPQRMVVAATRNLMDNAGLSAGPQIVLRKSGISPADGRWELSPLKIWYANEEIGATAVQDSFISIVFPMLQVELMNIIQLGMKMAEDVTGMPMLLQGQQGSAPETVGGMTMLNNNATSVLRRIARLFDSCITEPHILRYYAWLMEYSENNEAKGDFLVKASGSSALVERDIQNQTMPQIAQMALNPAFGWNPKKAGAEYLKSLRFDPSQFELSEEEQQQMAQQPPPEAPQIAVAKIRAQADAEKTKQTLAVELHKTKIDTDRDTAYVNAETEKNRQDGQIRLRELEMKLQLAQLDYAQKHEMTLEKVKAELAQTAMKLNTTKELARMSAGSKLLPKPVIEPPGRAAPGNSYPA